MDRTCLTFLQTCVAEVRVTLSPTTLRPKFPIFFSLSLHPINIHTSSSSPTLITPHCAHEMLLSLEVALRYEERKVHLRV